MVQDRATGDGVTAMRARILDAARELFLKKGFDNVSMRAIASKIGYSPGAIYRYFKNKKEILSVIRHEAFGIYLERMQGLDASDEPLEQVRAKLRLYIELALKDPEIFELMFNMGPSTVALGGEWAKRPRAMFDLFIDDIKACQQKGCFQAMEAEAVVVALWSGVHGYATLAVKERLKALLKEDEPDVYADQLIEILLAGA